MYSDREPLDGQYISFVSRIPHAMYLADPSQRWLQRPRHVASACLVRRTLSVLASSTLTLHSAEAIASLVLADRTDEPWKPPIWLPQYYLTKP